MSFTVSTAPLLALLVVLYFAANKELWSVLMFSTIFQGAALVSFGGGTSGLALAPAQVVLVVLILEKLLSKPVSGVKRPQAQTNVASSLFLYGAYAVLTAIFCPFVFEGIAVTNPRVGMDAPLTWSMYNVTQTIYLLLGIAVFWLSVYRSTLDEIRRALDWYVIGVTVAAGLAIYQYVAFNTGLPFPSEILHSNTQHAIFEAYDLGAFTRVNSTFTEAAAAAGSFSTALALVLWRLLFVEYTTPLLISLITLRTGLILTRSTMGYAALGFIFLSAAVLYLKKTVVTPRVSLFRNVFAVFLLLTVSVLMMIPSVRTEIGDLLDTVIFTKTSSASYLERTAWNEAALRAGSQTHWLGAGWGSLRASSLVANILGTVGMPGLCLFAAFCILGFRLAIRIPVDKYQTQRSVLLPVVVSLLDFVFGGPEMTDPVIWFLFGVAAFAPFEWPQRRDHAFSGRPFTGFLSLPDPRPLDAVAGPLVAD
jgi:hypothetical protein